MCGASIPTTTTSWARASDAERRLFLCVVLTDHSLASVPFSATRLGLTLALIERTRFPATQTSRHHHNLPSSACG